MKYVLGWLNWIKANKVLTLFIVITGVVSYILIINAKGRSSDCSQKVEAAVKPFRETLSEVTSLLNNMKPILANDVGMMDVANTRGMIPASFNLSDTTPKNKVLISKIDSLLKKIDSLKKQKQ